MLDKEKVPNLPLEPMAALEEILIAAAAQRHNGGRNHHGGGFRSESEKGRVQHPRRPS